MCQDRMCDLVLTFIGFSAKCGREPLLQCVSDCHYKKLTIFGGFSCLFLSEPAGESGVSSVSVFSRFWCHDTVHDTRVGDVMRSHDVIGGGMLSLVHENS